MATVDANGVAHHYDEHGSGPVVLLLHGGLESSESWAMQVPALAAAHRVVLIDRRGHGRTADVAGPITYTLMRDDTIACIEALDIAGAHLVGWSDGGIIALMVAIARPDLAGGSSPSAATRATTPTRRRHARSSAGDRRCSTSSAPTTTRASPDGPDHWPVVLEKVQTMWWDDPLDFRAELGGSISRR